MKPVTPQYMAAWLRLFARSPAELEAERKARQPAPAPQAPGHRKAAITAPQSTQTIGVLPMPHPHKRRTP